MFNFKKNKKSFVINSSVKDYDVDYKEPFTIDNFHDLDCFVYSNCHSDCYVTVWCRETDETLVYVGYKPDCDFFNARIKVRLNKDNFTFFPFTSLSLSLSNDK